MSIDLPMQRKRFDKINEPVTEWIIE